jgi:hypothetical protein
MPIHKDLKLSELHAVDAFAFATAGAREAAVVGSSDIGKIALQTDNESVWMLVAVNPAIWEELTSTVLEGQVVAKTRRIIAGGGLTGDGDLSTDRTLAVGSPPDGSIVVETDWVRVGVINDAQHGNRGGGLLHTTASQTQPGFLSAADKIKLDAAAESPYITLPCAFEVPVGALVILPSDGIAILASALEPNTVPIIGVVIAKPTPTTARVQSSGVVDVFENLVQGQNYYVGTYGLNAMPPIATPGRKLYTQKVGIALSATSLLLNISPDVVGYYSP